jgi:hypothetical protein
MKDLKKFLLGFITFFTTTLIVGAGVTYLWSLFFHEVAIVDWETSFRLAFIFGIVFPIIDAKKKKN